MIAVCADVLGNIESMNSMMEDAYAHGAKSFVSLGNLIGVGAGISEILSSVEKFDLCLQGDTERSLTEGTVCSIEGSTRRKVMLKWTRDNMSENDLPALRGLPTQGSLGGLNFFSNEKALGISKDSTKRGFIIPNAGPMTAYAYLEQGIQELEEGEYLWDDLSAQLVFPGFLTSLQEPGLSSYVLADTKMFKLRKIRYDASPLIGHLDELGLGETYIELLRKKANG